MKYQQKNHFWKNNKYASSNERFDVTLWNGFILHNMLYNLNSINII